MTPIDKLETKLDALAKTLNSGPSVAGRVMAEIENRSIAPVPWRDRFGHWLVRPAYGVPAYALIAVMVWALFFNEPGTLYAQVLKAVKAAQSVHAVGKTQRNGQWEPAYEIWYKCDAGVVEQSYRNGETITRIDNGTFQWKYDSNKKTAIKAVSLDPIGVIAEVLDQKEFRELLAGNPIDVTTIDGIACQHYRSVNPEKTMRMDVWIDERKLPLLYKETHLLEDGSERIGEYCQFEYNVPIDDSRFNPVFGPDVTIKESLPTADGKALFDKRFSLDNALYGQEVMGSIYAVHELKRFGDRLVFLLSSIRPSDETIREFGPSLSKRKLDVTGYSDFHIFMKGKQLENGNWRSGQNRTLAQINHDGIYANYDLLILKGDWPETIETFDICPYIHARGKLYEKYEKEGKTPYHSYQPLTTLPLPREDAPLSEIVSEVHEETRLLEPLVSSAYLFLGAVQDKDNPKMHTVYNRPPSALTDQEFLNEVMIDYERYAKDN